ncbi:MAG: ATPase, T2SS/T4P/T4SS family [Bacillus sp. (in: firmicutes)]
MNFINLSNGAKLANHPLSADFFKRLIEMMISKSLPLVHDLYRDQIDKKNVIDEHANDLTGFGPIHPLLLDEDVSEVMVNGPNQVFCERKGKVVLTPIKFCDNDHIMSVIEKIVAPLGKRVNESSPMVDVTLSDGARLNAIVPPLAKNGPTLIIRKFSRNIFKIEDLINSGTITEEIAIFLGACVKAKLNMFISGGTGSGKTTTLNVLSQFVPKGERIGLIGDVRGGEVLEMLQALSTGYDGSLATVYSNSPRDMIDRLEKMVVISGVDLSVKDIRGKIAGGLDIIIQQTRLKDGSRKITKITEVQGMKGDNIVLKDIFTFQQGQNSEGKIIGRLVSTGARPKFYDKLESAVSQCIETIKNS